MRATTAALTDVPEVKPRLPIAVRLTTMTEPPMSNNGLLPVFSTMSADPKTMPISKMLQNEIRQVSPRRMSCDLWQVPT
jgi:hypothetical protein